jgi:HSP20 family protein
MDKWDPLRELRSMQEAMNRLFERSRTRLHGEFPEDSFWQPPVDIFENERQVLVKMEVPEVLLQDIRISVEESRLTIEGERRQEEKESELHFLRLERSYGPFRRLFDLPAEIDCEHIVASCEGGVLKVVLPKKSPTRQKLL